MTDESFFARLRLLRALATGIAALLALRLFDLQVVRSKEYFDAAQGNAVQLRPLPAPRGRILDRRGVVLADERLAFDLVYVAAGTAPGHEEATAARLAEALAAASVAPPADLAERMRAGRRAPLRPVLLARDVPEALVGRLSWDGPFLPGVQILPARARRYPNGPLLAHLLGYVAEAGPDEIARGISMGDIVGVLGVESLFDEALRGEDGHEAVQVDVIGQPLRVVTRRPPRPGADVVLAADAEVSAWAREALAGRRGAVVVIDPHTGDLIALVSSPDFDPEAFSDRNRGAERLAYLRSDSKPMLARAVSSGYPPGSTFKVVTMAAGLRTGALRETTRFTCPGSYAGKRCWKHAGHGTLALVAALAHSCDVFFYHAGEAVGIEALAETARALGLGRAPGLGLGGREEEGIVPTPEWERENVRAAWGQHWGLGDIHNTAIGQGYVLASPLQVARFFGAAAFGGLLVKPRPALRVVPPGGASEEIPTEIEHGPFLDEADLAVLRAAMRAVVEGGTAGRLRIEGVPIGAKTGTAENPHGDDHAWIVAAVPMPEPRFVIAVLLENAGHGSSAAGPVARYVLERLAVREGWTVRKPA